MNKTFDRIAKGFNLLKSGGPAAILNYIRHHYEHPAAMKRVDEVAQSNMTISDKFSAIYDEKLWLKVQRSQNSDQSLSGHGSTILFTETLRAELELFLREIGANCFLDAPCGDLNWIKDVKLPVGSTYIGGDVVPALIDQLKTKHEISNNVNDQVRKSFLVIDLTKDALPEADAWLCRDCLQHLSNQDVAAALSNALKSDVDYFLITNYHNVRENIDIATGQYRPLDITLAPFNWPKPYRHLLDADIGDPHDIGVWRRRDVLSTLSCSWFG